MSDRMSRTEWEALKVQDFERLEAEVARLTQERDALAVALAQLKEACLEDIGGRHEEIQCALCLRYWPTTGPAQHDAACVLATDQPAAAGAELLAAAEAMREALARLTPGPYIGAMSGPESEGVRALKLWGRARAGHLAAGPGREGEDR